MDIRGLFCTPEAPLDTYSLGALGHWISSPHVRPERKHRTYKQSSELLALNLLPRAGLRWQIFAAHRRLWFSTFPTCADRAKQFKLTADLLQPTIAQATDFSTAVSFELCAEAPPPDLSASVLLDLQAGASEDWWGQPRVFDDEAAVQDWKFITDDEGIVVFEDVLPKMFCAAQSRKRWSASWQGSKPGTFARWVITIARYVLGPSIRFGNCMIMFANTMRKETNSHSLAPSRSRSSWHCITQMARDEKVEVTTCGGAPW